jgi:oxepin-CoA hydrolase/3-oxo-5,6-dehydrosuberyl-CoA semialdehyde dehydrogenase
MIQIQSYLEGKWQFGSGKASVLVDPSTEEPVAEACADGLDLAAALAFARDKGGAALRAMTFAERGELLRAMSRAIHGKRDELLALSVRNAGTTRSDAKFDVDGATGTLAYYADLGKELGATRVLEDGEAFQLARSPRLYGAHAWVPRRGVAVHINAFNFPAWGLGEKAACAILAGMPVFVKPATSTALVAFRIAQILVEERVLPDGVLSFLGGGAGSLVDHLTGQDVLAFTGSSATGQALRAGKAALSHGVRVNVEADSLNAAVLGPDVGEGSETLTLFVNDVVRDMTQKTGQKCTAIRRVYVPRDRVDAVVELLRDRLSRTKVGNPALDEVGMGPVATAQQLRDVRAGIEKLSSCAKVVLGGPGPVAGLGAPEGKGFFVAPTLLVSLSPKAGDAVHEHEVFGPVATVMPYDGTAEDAARLVAAGGGGLVSSVYSDDKDFVTSCVLAIAPFHGRVTIGSEKIAGQAVPPGTVLPSLIHGGPGRAGAGEELGGRRGLGLYMQRVALQGDRALLETVVGRRS